MRVSEASQAALNVVARTNRRTINVEENNSIGVCGTPILTRKNNRSICSLCRELKTLVLKQFSIFWITSLSTSIEILQINYKVINNSIDV